MNNYLLVENYPNLVRDKNSKAILNVNEKEKEAYLKKKEKRKSEKETINNLKKRQDRLEEKIDRILQILEK